jgi:3-oxoacyl-[acyl-carrier protein] reductase/(S)-1-phenylethanol dehydrogenase
MTEPRHAGKVAVITGAASGIGQAHALRLALEGAAVVIADVQSGGVTLRQIEAAGGRAIAVRCDVADPDSVAALGDRVAADFKRCDILVNNAGLIPARSFDQISFAEWRRIMAVNLDGVFLMTQRFLPGMRERRWGRIVNMASNTFGQKTIGLAHYVASKGGVIGFTRALSGEVGPYGVTVNAIAPAMTRTPGTEALQDNYAGMTQDELYKFVVGKQSIPRPSVPADLAATLSFLVSEDASFITGQTIYADGGVVRG